MAENTTTFRVQGAEGPWGDNSRVLIHGFASLYQRGMNGEIMLERMGPFVPPMTFPSQLGPVVSDSLKRELEASGLTGLTFRPVIKKHIARSRWHEWDWTAPKPRRYPRGREPANYVLTRPHSSESADEMGDLWETKLAEHDADLTRKPGSLEVLASARAKDFLEPRVGDWITFESLRAT